MKIDQLHWTTEAGWQVPADRQARGAQMALVFGDPAALGQTDVIDAVQAQYPDAWLLGCSTAGEIRDTGVYDGTVVASAVELEQTRLAGASAEIQDPAESRKVGRELAGRLDPNGLSLVFVLSDGLSVNGSELVQGLNEGLPDGVVVTGGLSADGDRFQKTLVLAGSTHAASHQVAAVGFYGDQLRVGHGSLGGWDSFGPMRTVTRSRGNVLFELDGRSALALYKEYLAEHAAGLPATGLLFPLSVQLDGRSRPLVRTILSVNEEEGSLTFAGDLPEGSVAQLMKANFDRLIDGAAGAARNSVGLTNAADSDLAILISCVGRKLVLQQRIEEEVEAVREELGDSPALTGFYSYGEISPLVPGANCELHNQTMTITTLSER
jgi:hypothetical protein